MHRVVYSQPIERTPEVAWAFLSDLRNDVKWRQEITAVELVSGEPHQAPAVYRESVRWERLKGEANLTVTESVPGKRLVVESDDRFARSKSVWTFEPQGEGALVTLVFSMETFGALHPLEHLTWNVVSTWLERDLPRLEGHLSAVGTGPRSQSVSNSPDDSV